MNNQNQIIIAVLAATNREQRLSHHAAEFVAELGRKIEGVEIIYVDPKEFYFPGDGRDPGAQDAHYSEIVAKADGYLVVTPEYNHSFPGTLKRMLDSEYKHYYHKAAALCGVSDGDWGGTRAVESLIPVFKAFGTSVTRNSAHFTHVNEMFDENGVMKEELREKYTKSVEGVYKELIWLTRALKVARDQDPQ